MEEVTNIEQPIQENPIQEQTTEPINESETTQTQSKTEKQRQEDDFIQKKQYGLLVSAANKKVNKGDVSIRGLINTLGSLLKLCANRDEFAEWFY